MLAIDTALSTRITRVAFPADLTQDSKPYGSCLEALEIIRTAKPACATVVANRLVLSGSDESLKNFSAHLSFADDLPSDCHVHFEHCPGCLFIDPLSLPLVISLA
jgi:hypothetical protein